jgi:hypothetical protein
MWIATFLTVLSSMVVGAPIEQEEPSVSLWLTNVASSGVKVHVERFCNPADVLYTTFLEQGDTQVEVDANLSGHEPFCLVAQRARDVAMGVHQFQFVQSLCEVVIADDDSGFGFTFASNCSLGAYRYGQESRR